MNPLLLFENISVLLAIIFVLSCIINHILLFNYLYKNNPQVLNKIESKLSLFKLPVF